LASIPQARTLRALQQKSIGALKAAGYVCSPAPKLSPFEVVAFCASDVVLVQLAINDWPDAEELKAMKLFPAPRNTRKLIHLWRKYARTPDIKEIR